MGKQYTVIIPMAGHLVVTVEAKDKEDAEQKAFEEATIDHLEDWEALKQFNRGNVCYCPSPWDLEVIEE